jgi:hypothetical protein
MPIASFTRPAGANGSSIVAGKAVGRHEEVKAEGRSPRRWLVIITGTYLLFTLGPRDLIYSPLS